MVLGSRYRPQGDFLGLGKLARTVGGFVPVVGPTISKIGSIIEGIGSKPRAPTSPSRPAGPVFSLPGGATVGIDSIKVKGTGVMTPIGSFGTASATVFPTLGFGGRKHKKIRRINPLNPKALSRSIRRIDKFSEFAKSVGYSKPPSRLKGIHAPKRRRRSCR